MNPEFQRNLWTDLSGMRLVSMPFVLGLAFMAIWTTTGIAADADGQLAAVAQISRSFFFFIVVVWGSWISARLVTGEIRERTWDAQRMSAIGPWTMVWGKLLGGTAFVWYGGAICLAPIMLHELSKDVGGAIETLLFYVSMGLFAHATAFFISMLAVRRKAAASRLASFFAFIAGITAANTVRIIWFASDWPLDVPFLWFGMEFDFFTFQLWQLALQVLWVLVGCYVLMRHELQIKTGPLAWIGFIVYSMILFAGNADLFGFLGDLGETASAAAKGSAGLVTIDGIPDNVMGLIRWSAAGITAGILTYAAIFVAPKDWVQMRWVQGAFKSGRIVAGFNNMPSWAYSFIAVVVAAVFAMAHMEVIELGSSVLTGADLGEDLNIASGLIPDVIDPRPIVMAAVLFLLRDIGIVLWFNAGKSAKRPDLAALITLIVLYSLLPSILAGMQIWAALPILTWWPGDQGWLHPVWPAVQAAVVFALVKARRRMVVSQS